MCIRSCCCCCCETVDENCDNLSSSSNIEYSIWSSSPSSRDRAKSFLWRANKSSYTRVPLGPLKSCLPCHGGAQTRTALIQWSLLPSCMFLQSLFLKFIEVCDLVLLIEVWSHSRLEHKQICFPYSRRLSSLIGGHTPLYKGRKKHTFESDFIKSNCVLWYLKNMSNLNFTFNTKSGFWSHFGRILPHSEGP